MRRKREDREKKRQNVREKLKRRRKKKDRLEKRRKSANDEEQLRVCGGCARSRKRDKEREAKGSRSLAREREREVARAMRVLIHGGGGSGGGSRQPAWNTQPRQVDSIHRRDKKGPNSRVSKGAEKKRETRKQKDYVILIRIYKSRTTYDYPWNRFRYLSPIPQRD